MRHNSEGFQDEDLLVGMANVHEVSSDKEQHTATSITVSPHIQTQSDGFSPVPLKPEACVCVKC